MRILHITHNYAPLIDGTVEYVRNLSEHLVDRSHSVSVVCTDALYYIRDGKRYKPKVETRNGVKVRRAPFYYISKNFEFLLTHLIKYLGGPLSPWVRTLFQDPGGLKILVELLGSGEEFDVIHATPVPRSCVAAAVLAGERTNTPTVVRPAFHLSEDRTSVDTWKPILQMADVIITSTNTEAKSLIDAGFTETNLETVGVGVNYHEIANADPDPSIEDDDLFTILSLSSSHSEPKGTNQVIRAARELDDVRFLFAGPGWENSEYDNSIPRNCEYIGVPDQRKKHQILNSVDLFVQPSISESFGIVFMEALSAGVPVIPANTPQMRELYSDVGVPVTHGKVAELVEAIRSLQTDHERYQRLAERAQSTAREYAWKNIASQIESIYESEI